MELYKKVCKSIENYTPTWLIFFLKRLYCGLWLPKKVCKSLGVVVKSGDFQTFAANALF